MDELERMFNQEIRDKKRTATGVHHRASRRGYVGTMRTPVDYLKGKAKKEYMKNGEIKVSSVYDDLKNVPQIAELENMELDKAQNIIKHARSKFKTRELESHWNVSSYTYYNIVLPRFKIRDKFPSSQPGYEKGSKKTKGRNAKNQNNNEVALTTDKVEVLESAAIIPNNVNQVSIQNVTINTDNEFMGLVLKFAGEYSGTDIVDRISIYLKTLINDSKYKVSFKIEELEIK